ncbi:MAG: 2-dehydro-3-deoxyphosphogluconate aldolase [Planctomycetes bacterium]|nr:2-dehydro-3-deoxyphosphogluconate aldolase [Planctomycetota bacterium]
MNTTNALTTLEALGRFRCSAILRTPHGAAAAPAMEAAVEGGFRAIEFTLNTPGALERIAEFSRRDGLLVGAGTVLCVADARAALDAGARFLVAPVFDPDVFAFCVEEGVLAIPGTYTPTEMLCAHRAGALAVKLFPGPGDGPAHVRACLGPMPFLRIMPTSGVTEENAAAFLAAGAFAVGFVNSLFDPGDMAAERFSAIRERARRMVAACASAGR